MCDINFGINQTKIYETNPNQRENTMIFHISLKMLMFCLESQNPITNPCYAKTVELAITIYTKQIDMV